MPVNALEGDDRAAKDSIPTRDWPLEAGPNPFARGRPERQAAVLAPLVFDQQWQLLFIRRADNPRDRHSGQVAFPGGRIESSDASSQAAALRETEEEIGILPSKIALLGELPEYLTSSNYRVKPWVGTLAWPTPLSLQKHEVARAFTVPLSWLRDPKNRQTKLWRRPGAEQREPHPVVFFEPYDQEVLWGATARMTLHLLAALESGQLQLPPAPR